MGNKIFSIPNSLLRELNKIGIHLKDFIIYINSTCNLRCKHCYVGNNLLAQNFQITAYSIKEFLLTCQSLERLIIIGGEPLLHPEINEIISSSDVIPIREKRITTNLLEMSSFDYNEAKNKKITICISLDGYNKELHDNIRGKNSFDKTISNIKKLTENNNDIEIIHTINSENISQFNNLLTLCLNLGIKKINLHRISLQGNAIKNKNLYVSPTEWRNFIKTICSSQRNLGTNNLLLRYPILFVNEIEYNKLKQNKNYFHHVEGSYHADGTGHRIVIYPDLKIFISSEAFGTESFIGQIINGTFVYNESKYNEMKLFETFNSANNYNTSLINNAFAGDERYPIPLSVSFKKYISI